MIKEQQLNDLFAKARLQAPKTSFEESKVMLLASLENRAIGKTGTKGKLFTLKNKIIMSVSIFITVTSAFIFMWTSSNTIKTNGKEPVAISIAPTDSQEDKINFTPIQGKQEVSKPKKNTRKNKQTEIDKSDHSVAHNRLTNLDNSVGTDGLQNTPEKSQFSQADERRIPSLTKDEIKKTIKQKKKMLKDLMKVNSEARVYAFIPASSFSYFGEDISVASFFIQRTEVSNLEYRTFLFDLIMQNRLEEFLIAKPDESMWTKVFKEGTRTMEETYFSHVAFNEYPVVNVSRAGAELYCKWLYEEAQKLAGEKELPFGNLRIPTRQEWVKAASGDGKNVSYPWGGESVKNEKSCYLANHKPTDSTFFDDGAFYTARVSSYFANGFGLFNMSGNVAEMVVDGAGQVGKSNNPQSATELVPGMAGGGWMNSANEIKISAPDNHPNQINPHPNIGFRVVMTRR
jgi:formylglycine-generating enzyme required for sulfatase activity